MTLAAGADAEEEEERRYLRSRDGGGELFNQRSRKESEPLLCRLSKMRTKEDDLPFPPVPMSCFIITLLRMSWMPWEEEEEGGGRRRS